MNTSLLVRTSEETRISHARNEKTDLQHDFVGILSTFLQALEEELINEGTIRRDFEESHAMPEMSYWMLKIGANQEQIHNRFASDMERRTEEINGQVHTKVVSIREEIEKFISEYAHIFMRGGFSIAFRGNTYDRNNGGNSQDVEVERLIGRIGNIAARYVIDNPNPPNSKYQSAWLVENAENRVKGELARLRKYGENIPGYILFRIYRDAIMKDENLEAIPGGIEILQRSPLIYGTDLEKWVNELLERHFSLLEPEQLWLLICRSENSSTILESILSPNTSISWKKFSIAKNIIEESTKDTSLFRQYEILALNICIDYIENTISKETRNEIDEEDLFDDPLETSYIATLYPLWNKLKKDINAERNAQISDIFEAYGEWYNGDIHLDYAHAGMLPISMIRKAIRGVARKLTESILLESNLRKEEELDEEDVRMETLSFLGNIWGLPERFQYTWNGFDSTSALRREILKEFAGRIGVKPTQEQYAKGEKGLVVPDFPNEESVPF